MDLIITQDTGMDKKKPNDFSPESTVWPAECWQKAPGDQGSVLAVCGPKAGFLRNLLHVLYS